MSDRPWRCGTCVHYSPDYYQRVVLQDGAVVSQTGPHQGWCEAITDDSAGAWMEASTGEYGDEHPALMVDRDFGCAHWQQNPAGEHPTSYDDRAHTVNLHKSWWEEQRAFYEAMQPLYAAVQQSIEDSLADLSGRLLGAHGTTKEHQ